MKTKILASVGVTLAVALATAASASELLFTYTETGPGAIDFSFDQASNPTPLSFTLGTVTDVPVTNWSGNIGPYSAIQWFSAASSGQFNTQDDLYVVFGPQIYGGTEDAPTFGPGTFAGADQSDGLVGTLVVTSVPEPAGWMLMLVGIGGLGAAMRTRKRESVAA